MRRGLCETIALTLTLIGQCALAKDMTFGPEFEFSAPRMHWIDRPVELVTTGYSYPGAREQRELKRFAERVAEKCKTFYPCLVEEVPGKWDAKGAKTYRVLFPDGWFFSITPDAWVVEITAAPLTLEQLKEKQPLLDEMIFNTAAEIDLDARGSDVFGGFGGKAAGHVNFGTRSAFGESGQAWLKYFVDYANYPELAGGAMQRDIINAPSFSTLGSEPHRALEALVNRVNGDNRITPPQVAEQVLSEVYTTSPVMKSEANHYQALGIKHVVKIKGDMDLPTEHRAVMSQRNTEEFILMAELITARVKYLSEMKSKSIVLSPYRGPKFGKQDLVGSFYLYVSEVGMSFDKYRVLLRPELKDIEPDAFVRGVLPVSRSERSEFLRSLRFHLPKLAHSSLVKKRMDWVLSEPQFSEERPWVIDLIMSEINANPNTEYAKSLLDYMYNVKSEIKEFKSLVLPGPIKSVALRCQSLY